MAGDMSTVARMPMRGYADLPKLTTYIRLSSIMKDGIHPKYHKDGIIKCACGKTFPIGSTSAKLEVEICSNCHPYYTGKNKMIDTAGRVEKFKTRMAKKAEPKTKKVRAKKAKSAK